MRSKTRFVVVRVMKGWPDNEPPGDRRRYRRFDSGEVSGKLALIAADGSRLTLAPCKLVDVSFGGMCFLADEPLAKDCLYRFLIDFASPFCEIVLVKARVAWMQPSDEGLRIGVEFVESSKGWLGPEGEADC